MTHEVVTSKTVKFYRDRTGNVPFVEWLHDLKDIRIRHRVESRIGRVRLGNLGDWKAVGGGVFELRLDFGTGYRIYIGMDGERVILILCAGDKSSQASDIMRARSYWKDYREHQNGNAS